MAQLTIFANAILWARATFIFGQNTVANARHSRILWREAVDTTDDFVILTKNGVIDRITEHACFIILTRVRQKFLALTNAC